MLEKFLFGATGASALLLQIRGFSKKGKEFYRLKTNLTEAIQSIVVLDDSIWLASKYVFLQYVDNKETQFYMSPERINSCEVELLSLSGTAMTLSAIDAKITQLLHCRGGSSCQ